MTNKERYATIGGWARIFREEGTTVGERAISNHLKQAGIVGETARNRMGCIIRQGYYAESEVRDACFDLLNPFDSFYFQNVENVRADLIAFADQLGANSNPLFLHTGNMLPLSITCRNGRVVRGQAYIRTAAIALGFAENAKNTGDKMAYTLKHLLKTAGFEVFDKDYFENPAHVRADLEAFASQLGEGKTASDLSSFNMSPLTVTCKNGQSVKGGAYLCTAAVALGFADSPREASPKMACTIKHLLQTAGFEMFDRDYFENPAHVRTDLEAFASQLGEGKNPSDLSTGNFSSLSITCCNGRVVKGQAYVRNAAKVLGLAKNDKEAGSKMAYALKRLLAISGSEISEYLPLDASYFNNPAHVRADLEAFATQIGEDRTLFDLSVNNISSVSITCQNGQALKGQAYLWNAAKALGFVKSTRDSSKCSLALKVLKETVGIKS